MSEIASTIYNVVNTCIYTYIYSRTKNMCVLGLYVFVHTLYVLLDWACVFFCERVFVCDSALNNSSCASVPFVSNVSSLHRWLRWPSFVRVCMRKGTRMTGSGVNIKRAFLFTYVLQVTVTTCKLSHTCIVDLVHSQEVSTALGWECVKYVLNWTWREMLLKWETITSCVCVRAACLGVKWHIAQLIILSTHTHLLSHSKTCMF